eukprot:scaffold74191_cov72-Phaeocystis_antarctica.AAC.5
MLLADTLRVHTQIAKGLASLKLRGGRQRNGQATPGTYTHWSAEVKAHKRPPPRRHPNHYTCCLGILQRATVFGSFVFQKL